MTRVTCPGVPASWINGWLAAVGATMLDSRIRLQWTADRTPVAVPLGRGCRPGRCHSRFMAGQRAVD